MTRKGGKELSKPKQKFFDYVHKNISITSTAFFRFDGNRKPISFGSGVFIALKDRCFILTAAHVGRVILEVKKVYYPSEGFGGSLVPLHYQNILLPASKEETIDVGVIVLSGSRRDYLRGNRRVATLSKVHVGNEPNRQGIRYFLIGLPSEHSQMDIKEVGAHKSHMSSLFLVYESVKYRQKRVENYDSKIHILINHRSDAKQIKYTNSDSTWSQMGQMPSRFEGLSGSGIWRYVIENNQGKRIARGGNLKLVGIQQSVKHNAYVKGTKIGYALALIYKEYPNLPDPYGFFRRGRGEILLPNSRWQG